MAALLVFRFTVCCCAKYLNILKITIHRFKLSCPFKFIQKTQMSRTIDLYVFMETASQFLSILLCELFHWRIKPVERNMTVLQNQMLSALTQVEVILKRGCRSRICFSDMIRNFFFIFPYCHWRSTRLIELNKRCLSCNSQNKNKWNCKKYSCQFRYGLPHDMSWGGWWILFYLFIPFSQFPCCELNYLSAA